MAAIKHAKTNTRTDTSDATAVQPSDWNADHTITSDLDVGTHKVVNVVDPVNPQDAATKNYVDTHGGGGGGITNSAPNNKIMRSNGTNAVDSSITDTLTQVSTSAPIVVSSAVAGTVIAGGGSSVSTSIGNQDVSVKIQNTNSTANTWESMVFQGQNGPVASIEVQNVDQTNRYGDINFATRAADGYLSRVKIASAGPVTVNSNLTVTNDLILSGSNPLVLSGTRHINAAINTSSVAIANTETVVVSMTVPANTLTAGSTFQFFTNANTGGAGGNATNFRLRIGPTTLTGTAVITETRTDSSQLRKQWSGSLTFRTVGASGSVVAHSLYQTPDGGGYDLSFRNEASSPVTIDTTVSNRIEITFISGNAGSTYTFFEGYINQVL